MRLFDAHCHVQDEAALALARAAGVAGAAVCGTGPEDWPAVARMAVNHSFCRPQYGLHPWHLPGDLSAAFDQLADRLQADPLAGVGEIGLDRAVDPRNEAAQRSVFDRQLGLARELGRPVSIHCRRAWDAVIPTLRRFAPFRAGFVLHAFSGPRDRIPELAALGGFFSFSGALTYSGNRRGPLAVRETPVDRLLIETDAPDRLPHGLGGAGGRLPNTSANLSVVFRCVAELRGDVSEGDLEQALWENAGRLFGDGNRG